MVEEVRSSNGAMRVVTEQLTDLARRVQLLEGVEREVGAPIQDSEDLRRRLAWLAGEIQARGDVLTRAADEVDRMGSELSAVRLQTTDQVAGLQARVRQVEVAQGPVGLRHELDRVAAEVTGVPDFAEIGRSALRTIELESSVGALRQDLERITRGLGGLQQAAMAHVAGRTAPLEGAIHELRQDLTTTADDAAAARAEGDARLAEGLAVLGSRLTAVETVPGDLEGIRLGIDGLRTRVAEATEAAAAAVDERLQVIESKIAALDSVNGDVEGLYRELDRIAERSAAYDDALSGMAERFAGIEAGSGELRQAIDQLAVEVVPNQQMAMADLGERVQLLADRIGALGFLAGELRELQVTVGGLTDEVSYAQQAALAATTEQLAVSSRLRELDSVPTDIEGLHRELDRVTGEASSIRESVLGAAVERLTPLEAGLGQLDSNLNLVRDSLLGQVNELAARVGALEPMTEDFEGVHRELDRLMAQTSTLRDAVMAEMAESVTPMVEGLNEVRTETVERLNEVRTELVEGLNEVRTETVERLNEVRTELVERLIEVRTEVDSRSQAVDGAVGDLASRLATVEPVAGHYEPLLAEVREINRRLQPLEPLAGEFEGVHRELGRAMVGLAAGEGRSADLADRLADTETAVEGLRSEVSRLAAEADEAVATVVARLEPLEPMVGEFDGVHRELDRAIAAATAEEGRVGDLSNGLAATQKALDELRDDFVNLAGEAQAAVEAMASRMGDVKPGESLADAVARLRGELGALDSLQSLKSVPERIEAMSDEVNTVIGRLASRQQADVANAAAELQELDSRLAAVESVPADMDGLYAALYGLAASLKALGAEVPDVMPEPPKLVGTRRVPARKPRGT